MPGVNDEFSAELEDLEITPPAVAPKGKKKPAAPALSEEDIEARIAAAVAKALEEAKQAAPVVDRQAGERPNSEEDGAYIIIDDEAGRANYEVVAVNGEVLQIKRNARVWVPRRFIKVLETCRTIAIDQKFNRASGEYEDVERVYSAIPWRKA